MQADTYPDQQPAARLDEEIAQEREGQWAANIQMARGSLTNWEPIYCSRCTSSLFAPEDYARLAAWRQTLFRGIRALLHQLGLLCVKGKPDMQN